MDRAGLALVPETGPSSHAMMLKMIGMVHGVKRRVRTWAAVMKIVRMRTKVTAVSPAKRTPQGHISAPGSVSTERNTPRRSAPCEKQWRRGIPRRSETSMKKNGITPEQLPFKPEGKGDCRIEDELR